MNACDVCEETDEEARERRIGAKLQKCSNQRETYVTSILEVPEVKQGQLKTPVKLDLFKTLNEHLTNQYIAAKTLRGNSTIWLTTDFARTTMNWFTELKIWKIRFKWAKKKQKC